MGFKAWTYGSEKKIELETAVDQLDTVKRANATAQEAVTVVKLIPNEGGKIQPLNAAVSHLLLSVHESAILNGIDIISISNAKSAENELTLQNVTDALPMSAGLLVSTPLSIKMNYASYAGLKAFLQKMPELNLKIKSLKLSGTSALLEVSLLSKSSV